MVQPIPETTPGTVVATRTPPPVEAKLEAYRTDSWVDVAGPIFRLAAQIADTEFVPKQLQGNAPAVAAVILHGRELGLGPMTALAHTHVIEGRTSISAEGQRAQVLAAGHELEFVESTGSICTVRGRRAGTETWTIVTWSIDMARAANLTNKSNWRSYPRRMLQARASAELCQMIFPDVLSGISATEELEDDLDGDRVGDVKPATTKITRKGTSKAALPPPPNDPTPPEQGAGDLAVPAPAMPALPGESEPPSTRSREGGPRPEGGPLATGEDSASVPAPSGPPTSIPEPRSAKAVEAEAMITDRQHRMLMPLWTQLGIHPEKDRDDRLAYTSVLVDRTIGSQSELRKVEAIALINRLSKIGHSILGDDSTLSDLDEVTVRRLRAALEAEVARVQDERAGQ